MFPNFSTLLVNTMRGLSRALGNELAVIVSEHKIKLKMVDPDKTSRYWDTQMFSYGNLYFEDYANPIKPKHPDTEEQAKESLGLELISSERYKSFMEQNLITDIINEGQDGEFPTLMHILLISGAMHLITISVLLWIALG